MLSTLLEELQRRRVGWLSAFGNTPMGNGHDFGPSKPRSSHSGIGGGFGEIVPPERLLGMLSPLLEEL